MVQSQRTSLLRVTSIFLVTMFCLHVCFATQRKRKVLNYEPANVTLTGVVVSKTYYGPPDYGESPKTDSRESQYVLILDSAVDVVGDQSEPTTELGVKRVTLVVNDFKAHPVENLLGTRVEVQGTLFHASTGHHHTKVLINVTSIRQLK